MTIYMKPYLLSAALILPALTATAQEPADTLVVVNNAHSITVTETPAGNTITIVGQGDDKEYYYQYSSNVQNPVSESIDNDLDNNEWGMSLPFLKEKKRKKSEVIWLGQTYVGIALPVNEPRGLDASVECGVGQLIGASFSPWAKGPSFAIGFGIHYQQYTLHNALFSLGDKRLSLVSPVEGASDLSSRLCNFGFQIPFTITQKICHEFGITVGAALKFNTYTTASSKYHLDDVTYQMDFKGLQQHTLGADIYAAIGLVNDIGLYVRYTPTDLFRSGYGPRFNTVSFGITIGM